MPTRDRFRAGDVLQQAEGQGTVEYGLILVLISVTLIGALQLLSEQIAALFEFVRSTLAAR